MKSEALSFDSSHRRVELTFYAYYDTCWGTSELTPKMVSDRIKEIANPGEVEFLWPSGNVEVYIKEWLDSLPDEPEDSYQE